MGSVRFIGNAQDVANKHTITVSGTWTADDTATFTINGKELVLTIGTDVAITDVIAAIVAAWNGDDVVSDETRSAVGTDIPEFAELTAAVESSTTLTLTGNVAGVPHAISVAEDTFSTGAVAIAETVEATGKNWWDNTANWDTGVVPVNSDDVFYDNIDIPIYYGLAQSGVTLGSLIISNLQAGAAIGLPKVNANGYHEYRATELAIGITSLRIDDTAASRIKINFGSVANTTEVLRTGFGENGVGAVLLRGTSITTLEVHSGNVDVARYGGEVSTITTLRNSGGTVYLGAGLTGPTTIVQTGGSTTLRTNVTTMTVTGGTLTLNGAATVTTLTVSSATMNYRSSGTATTVVVGRDGVVDTSGDASGRTFTTTTINAGGRIRDPHRTITYTNKIAAGSDVQEVVAA